MTLVAAAEKAAKNAKHRELKTLVIDIERRMGVARFFDLRTNYISPDAVERWPSTLCFAAQWLGESNMEFHAAWNDHRAMTVRAHELLSEADIVVSYNGIKFDEKHLASDIIEAGLTPPAPFKSVDLLRVVRSNFGFESKRLTTVLDRLSMPAKNDKYDPTLAEAAVAGDERAQKRLERYNTNDVKITGALYWRLLPWIKGHPHVAPIRGEDKTTCPRCTSTKLTRSKNWTPGVYQYRAFSCDSCGGYFRTTYEAKGPSVRAL